MGLNTLMEPGEILDNEMSDCENFSVDETSIRLAPGYIGYQATVQTGKHWGIFHFRKSDGTQRLVRQTGTKLQYDNGSGTWADCTLPTAGSPAETVVLTECQPTFAMLNDIIIFSNGVDNVMSSADGITWTDRSTLPKAKYLINNGANRILFCNTSTSPSIIWWSEINNPLSVLEDSWEYIEPNSGAEIRGVTMNQNGRLLLFKEDWVYDIDDITEGMVAVTPIGQVKLASHHTICPTENSVLFLGVDGIYEFTDTIRKVSGRISWTGRNDISNWNLATAVYANGEYRVSMPDADVSQNYNAQEYVLYKNKYRQDPEQPYVITRNNRYFGCYGIEYKTGSTSRRVRVYAGFSTTFSEGSPAETNCNFVYINIYKDTSITQGLNGSAQSAFLITKYFTDNIPYYVKKYKKMFYELTVSNEVTNTFSYRFSPYSVWTDVSVNTTTGDIEWTLSDGSLGDFSEGYGFADEAIGRGFIDINNSEKPRGIQFKISTSSINDVIFIGFAYSFRPKAKFK